MALDITPERFGAMLGVLPAHKQAAVAARLQWLARARPKQIPPQDGGWFVFLMSAGRGHGKTLTGANEAWWHAAWNDGHRVAVVAPTAGDLRRTCFEGESGILNVVPHACLKGGSLAEAYNRSLFELHFENGSIIQGYSADSPERLRGPQFHFGWADEAAAWSEATAAFDMLTMTMRLGKAPRIIVTTTPRPIPLLRSLLAREGEDVVVVRGTTFENEANLAPGFIEQLKARYSGTRLGRQELEAEILEDVPGALWTRAMVEAARLPAAPAGLPPPEALGYHRALAEALALTRIVVGVDPSGSSGEDDETADEIGIVAVGVDAADRAFVLEDASGQYSPEGWGRKVVEVYQRWGADRIVAERNFGGAMVQSTIRAVDRMAPVMLVTSSRGKALRAEPVAALYEQGRVQHAGSFPQLEDQCCAMTRHGYQGPGSPDRLDALVFSVTDLLLSDGGTYDLEGFVGTTGYRWQ